MTAYGQRPAAERAIRALLIDGNNLLRSIHERLIQGGDRESPDQAKAAIDTAFKAVFKDLREFRATHVMGVFDGQGGSWRSALYPAYKCDPQTGERKGMPQAIRQQLPVFMDRLEAAGVKTVRIDGHEADDVIATLVAKLTGKPGIEVIIDSTDNDFPQLIAGNVSIYDRVRKVVKDAGWVADRYFGLKPHQLWDMKAFAGDGSDNIPGVKGIGDKRAAALLAEYGSLDNVLLCAHEIKGKMGENLRGSIEEVRLYRQLIEMNTDLVLGVSLSQLRYEQPSAVVGMSR